MHSFIRASLQAELSECAEQRLCIRGSETKSPKYTPSPLGEGAIFFCWLPERFMQSFCFFTIKCLQFLMDCAIIEVECKFYSATA